jgi:predicted TIM-barrel fold metal-dependent hydrolase
MLPLEQLRIVDSHHHFWNLQENHYPWLTGPVTKRVCGDYSAIRRNYLPEDLFRDASGLILAKSVHVQAEHDHGDPVRETRWLQSIADHPANRGFPCAIVAYADLSEAGVEAVLDGHCQYKNIRGIRQMLHEAMVDPDHPRPSLLRNGAFRKAIGLLPRYGLSFDLQVYYPQMADAWRLVKENPAVQFILCHTGQPARRDPDGIVGWRQGIRLLAGLPNVAVKISGLGMFDRQWTTDGIRPYVLHTIDTFGVERCMFGSNFPVDGMMATYRDLWNAYSDITADFTEKEREGLFAGNAEKYYRI